MHKKIPKGILEAMAKLFGILAEPTRLAIIHRLMKGGEQNVTEIVRATGHSHQNVSKHLRHLRTGSLVARRKEGLQVFYRLANPIVEKLCHLVCESLVDEFDPKSKRDGDEC
jgi:DNA-binding transcriptional ArsR family regulator